METYVTEFRNGRLSCLQDTPGIRRKQAGIEDTEPMCPACHSPTRTHVNGVAKFETIRGGWRSTCRG